MILRSTLCSTLTLTIALTAASAWTTSEALAAEVSEVNPGEVIEVTLLPADSDLSSQHALGAQAWEQLPIYRTQLITAPPVHPSVILRFNPGAPQGEPLDFQVARDSEHFYIRLRWQDHSEDLVNSVDAFSDSVAVQYAMGGSDTSFMMGTPDKPVNIWYWRADREEMENLAAGGFGSTTMLPEQSVTGASEYHEGGEWQVVMSRPLATVSEHEVSFERAQIPVTFAIWQGSDDQRDGSKRVTSSWFMLDTGHGES